MHLCRALCLGIAAMVFCSLSTGCATIMDGKNSKPVQVTSNPSGLPVEIYDAKKNKIVAHGTTPFTAKLKRSSGYFAGAKYRFKATTFPSTTQPSEMLATTQPTTQPYDIVVKAKLSGWYFGNVAMPGGSVGSLVIDPLTGAMWDLPKNVHLGAPTTRPTTQPTTQPTAESEPASTRK